MSEGVINAIFIIFAVVAIGAVAIGVLIAIGLLLLAVWGHWVARKDVNSPELAHYIEHQETVARMSLAEARAKAERQLRKQRLIETQPIDGATLARVRSLVPPSVYSVWSKFGGLVDPLYITPDKITSISPYIREDLPGPLRSDERLVSLGSIDEHVELAGSPLSEEVHEIDEEGGVDVASFPSFYHWILSRELEADDDLLVRPA